MDATLRAVPFTDIQRKGFKDMPTVKAAFGGGIPLINLDQGSAIPYGFVLQLPHELTPSDIGDGFGKAVVGDHVLDGQTLDAYDLVLAYDLGRELVLIITASVGDAGVYPSNLLARLLPVLGAFALLRVRALRVCQFLFVLGKEARVAVGVTIGGDDHRLQAQVQPDHLGGHRQGRDVLFNEQRDEVAPGTVLRDGDGCGLAPIGQGTRPTDLQRGIHLCQRETGAIPLEGGGRVLCRLDAVLLVERGIACTPFKEIAERFVQMSERLLRRNTRDLIEPGRFWLVLEDGERGRGLMIANPLLMVVIGIGPQAQRPIVDVAHTAKGPSQHLLLLVGGIASVLVRPFLFHASHPSTYRVKSQAWRTACRQLSFLPGADQRGVSRKEFYDYIS